jgi:hypothetical protein
VPRVACDYNRCLRALVRCHLQPDVRNRTDVICNLTAMNAANEQLFGTTAVRDALVAVGAQAMTTVEACLQWCAVICNLSCAGGGVPGASPATRRNLQLLRVASVRKAHAALKIIASSSAQAKTLWALAALGLADDVPGAAPAAAAE